MAGSAERKHTAMKMEKTKKSKKRKLSSSSDIKKPSKIARMRDEAVEEEEKVIEEPAKLAAEQEITDENRQWRNLELALSIQNKEIDAHKKVEMVFNFVISRVIKEDNDAEEQFNTLSVSRLIVYISNWIQSLLITSEKKFQVIDKESEESQFCLDYRCWQILKFCLEESSRLQVSLSLSRDLLKVVSSVARRTLHLFNNVHTNVKRSSFTMTESQLYNSVNDCLKLLFHSHGQLLNGNLDLWTVTVSTLLELVITTFAHKLQDSDVGTLITQLSCLVLEQFSKFLRVHPCRRNGFRDFVDKLLEKLLHLLGILPEQILDNCHSAVQKLFNLVQEIVSCGLFHAVHLDEYLSLHGTEKYSSLAELGVENSRALVKSYIRHLFDKLANLVSEKKVYALSGIGEMFRLFVNCVKNHKRDSQDSDASRPIGSHSTKDLSKTGNLTSEKSKSCSPSWNMRKSCFDFFVLTTEPLLLDLRKHLEFEFEFKTFMIDVNFSLKSLNKILSTMVRERIYVRTEDNSGGACLSFFKISYSLLLSCYAKLSRHWSSNWANDNNAHAEVLHSVAKESAFVVKNFMEIEYEVIGDDLVSIWLMILTLLGMGRSSEAIIELCPLSSVAVDLGCRVVDLYSELRQVNHALSALCRALRHFTCYQVDDEMKPREVLPSNFSLCGDAFVKSGRLLLCSQRFRLAVCDAIKTMPEGQADGYIQALSADVSDSLEWMKVACSMTDEGELGDANFHHKFSAQVEILGVVLSEIYSLVLDSVPVTTGNSYRTGVSLEDLIGVLRPYLTLLVSPEQDGMDTFISSVLGIASQSMMVKCKNDLQDKAPFILLFFFRLYMSCRSLYRQTLSLMPPKSTKKMSGMMADLCTAYSGDDLLEITDFEEEGYFSWVVRPSSSLLSMMLMLKGTILQEGSACHSCLIYVMHIMALQRLGDLARQIKTLEYIVQRSENVINNKSLDDADLSCLRKKKRKHDKFLSGLKQEASCLTGFIMEYLSAVDDEQLQISMLSARASKASDPQCVELGSWDLGVCTVDEKTLHIALWWIICQNTDIWCNYASKKQLELFLSQAIYNALPNEGGGDYEGNSRNKTFVEMTVTRCGISQDLLCDTSFYDQRFVCRYIVSRICNVLKKLAPLLFGGSSNLNVELSSCEWIEALNVLTHTPMPTREKPDTLNCSSSDLIDESCSKQTSSSPLNLYIAASRRLLNLLCQMMERAFSFKSFSRCIIYLLNFERLIVGSFLGPHGTLCFHEQIELLGLLVSCRRTLRYLLVTFCEESETYKSSSLPIFSESPSPIFWLISSLNLVTGWWNSMTLEHDGGRVKGMLVSLMDQTSYVFVTICKHQFGLALHLALTPKQTEPPEDSEGTLSTESSSSSKLSKSFKAYESLAMIVEALEVETKSLISTLEEAFNSGNVEAGVPLADMNKISSLLSCVQGFLWGLECASNDMGAKNKDLKAKLMKHKSMSRIINFADIFVKFTGISSRIFLCSDQLFKTSCDHQEIQNSEIDNHSQKTDASLKETLVSGSGSGKKKQLVSENAHNSIAGLVEFGFVSFNCLNKDLLQSFLDGQNLEASYFFRRLLTTSSAIVRLGTLIKCSPLSSNTVQVLLGCSEFLLTKFSQMPGMPNKASFHWLDGAVKFLEALGSQFQLTDSTTAQNIYTKLMELNINAIGKCISLQGKGATSASHDIESSTKLLSQSLVLRPTLSDPFYGLDDLKASLRISFKVLIEKPSESHLVSVMHSLHQALLGKRAGFTTIYDIQMGCSDGGVVSSVVAAGVDCLDLLLEFLKGNKLLNLVKTHLNGLVASLFNIVAHLQGPTLFYGRPNSAALKNNADSGSVILMCVEVLARIAGKPGLFNLDFHHLAQSLHIPGAIFQSFSSLKEDKASSLQSLLRPTDTKEYGHLECYFLVDRHFSINLYAASCRLLSTVVKHRKSDCVRCISLLQTSLQALLHCLENVSIDTADRKGYFTWKVEEGVKCASYLRRVYEEIRQQKEVFGQQGFKFLSDYIWVVSGYGSLKQGLKRKVDEALRPGVYALIDICSPDDLQHLHTVFGEGPCRSTLASLKYDYEHNFKYGGKV